MTHELIIERRKIIVKAQVVGINGFRECRFILDTGAAKSIIGDGAAKDLGFDLHRLQCGDRLMTAGGGVSSKILKLPKISLFGKDLDNFEVNVLNFPLQISYFVDGLIGMDF